MPNPKPAVIPAALSHFVIFSPTLKPPKPQRSSSEHPRPPSSSSTGPDDEPKDHVDPGEIDHDLEDDLREAAQILFYTSRTDGGVSRDTMLRQVGLARGLMGFADMLAPDETEDPKLWAVHTHRTRMIVFEPEDQFYIYINATLSHMAEPSQQASSSGTSKMKAAEQGTGYSPAPGSQGLIDRMLVDGLRRGYEDFRLQHGKLASLLPRTRAVESLVDNFFTRFALRFEATYLAPSPPNSASLPDWLGVFPAPAANLAGTARRALEAFVDDANLEGHAVGLVDHKGPIVIDGPDDPALERYLVGLVRASLPALQRAEEEIKRGSRRNLGVGLGHAGGAEPRKSSWATLGNFGWVPGLGSSKPASPAPGANGHARRGSSDSGRTGVQRQSQAAPAAPVPRWPNLGLSSLGNAVGGAVDSMGNIIWLGGGTKPADATPTEAQETRDVAPRLSVSTSATGESSTRVSADIPHEVIQTPVALTDLEAAVTSTEAPLGWQTRQVWLKSDGEEYAQRHLSWLIRDGTLLFTISPAGAGAPASDPSSSATMAVFSKITSNPAEPPAASSSTTSHGIPPPNSVVYLRPDGSLSLRGPEMDALSATALTELRSLMADDSTVGEAYAKTGAARFIAAKRTMPGDRSAPRSRASSAAPSIRAGRSDLVVGEDDEQSVAGSTAIGKRPNEGPAELYMLVGRKEASLTDAEAAVRSFVRTHPEVA